MLLNVLEGGGQVEPCFALIIGIFSKLKFKEFVMTKVVSKRDICFICENTGTFLKLRRMAELVPPPQH